MAVTSTVRKVVTCGAVKALRTIASAVCLRTPRIGMRVVRSPGVGGARRSSTTGAAVTDAAPDAGRVGLDVGAGDQTGRSARLDQREVDAELLRELAHRRGRARPLAERLDRLVRVDHIVGGGLEHRGVDADRRSGAAAGPPLGATRAARRGSVADEVRLGLLFRCVLLLGGDLGRFASGSGASVS